MSFIPVTIAVTRTTSNDVILGVRNGFAPQLYRITFKSTDVQFSLLTAKLTSVSAYRLAMTSCHVQIDESE